MNASSLWLRIFLRITCVLVLSSMIRSDKFLRAQDLTDQKASKTVSIVASHDIPIAAERIRVLMILKVESRDAKKALTALAEQQDKVTKEFSSLGATPTSIEFTTPTVHMGVPGVDDPENAKKRAKQQAAQLRNLNVRGRLGTEEVNEDAELPIVYTAASRVTAEWPLSADDKTTNLLLPSKIRATIENKDLRGKSIRVVLSEDEQKALTPLISNTSVYTTERAVPEIFIVYVARPTEPLELEITREAMKKATNQANAISNVLGRKIAGLKTVSISPNTNTAISRTLDYSSGSQILATYIRKDSREVIHDDVNMLRLAITISVQFELEP